MPRTEADSPVAPGDKAARIEQIIATLIETHRSDDDLDPAVIVADHPELMPELGERLDTLRAIHFAKRRAASSSLGDQFTDAPRDEDLGNLREAFPAYEILEQIHYGGQGVVYRAVQRATKRVVALKVMLDGPRATERQRQRFEREAELISRLEHPNIVTLFESGLARGRLYYAMQYVDGAPIDDYLLVKDLPVRQTIELFVKVCRAVAYAHQNGVIHRDLHAANILVDSDGQPHLLDFGLAKDAYADPDARVSAPGQVLGALPYLSPEQVGGGDGRVDVRSDVYSLGVVLYLLLTECFPYRVQGPYGTVREEIVSRPPLPLRKAFAAGDPERRAKARDVSADLEAILHMALAKGKDERYQSAADLADDLERFLSGGAVAARAANRLYAFRKALRRYRAPVAVAALIMAILATSTLVTMRALENSRAATRIAYDQFDRALTTIEDAIRPLPGGVAVRDELLQQVSESLPDLAARAAADPALRDISTKLSERQGDIAHAQGRDEEALRHYEQSLDSHMQDWDRGAMSVELAAGVIRLYRKLAAVAPDPPAVYAAGLSFAERAAAALDLDCAAALELCELQLRFGQYWKARRAHAAALPYLAASLATYDARNADCGSGDAWHRLAATTLNIRGQIRLAQGDAEAGLSDLQHSRQMREEQLAVHPADTVARQHLASVYARIATAERDAGHMDAAVDLLVAAVTHRTLLHELDPSVVSWGCELLANRVRLARLYLELGRLDDAKSEYAAASAVVSQLQRVAPSDESVLELRAFAWTLHGEILYAEESYQEALEAFREAATVHCQLLEHDPENQQRMQYAACAHQWIGRASGKLGDYETAADQYRRACQGFRSLYRMDSQSPLRVLDLVRAQVCLAAAGIHLNTPDSRDEARRLMLEADSLLDADHTGLSFAGFEARWGDCRAAVRTNLRLAQEDHAEGAPN